MNLKSIGQREPLKNEPRTTLPENTKSPNLQAIGEKIKLQTSPSTVKYGANTPNGQLKTAALEIPLKDKPMLGYQSTPTAMSQRAEDSKKGY